MKNSRLRVAHLKLEMRSKMENFMVTEVSSWHALRGGFDRHGSYTLRKRGCSCIALISFTIAPRNLTLQCTKLHDPVALRGLTVLRFNFKVELEAATEY